MSNEDRDGLTVVEALEAVSNETASEIANLPSDEKRDAISLANRLDPSGSLGALLMLLSPSGGQAN